jgi:hypothetical protein
MTRLGTDDPVSPQGDFALCPSGNFFGSFWFLPTSGQEPRCFFSSKPLKKTRDESFHRFMDLERGGVVGTESR